MSKNDDIKIVSNVNKQAEYKAFINLVKKGKIPPYWQDIAEALHVRSATISEWKKLPEFQEALLSGIDEAWEEMKKAGKRDWRMWQARYDILVQEQKGKGLKVTQDKDGMTVEFLEFE